MPTARYGELFSQVVIFDWLGASHWSKPLPVKLPGVIGLPDAADTVVEARAPDCAAVRPVAARAARMKPTRTRRRRGWGSMVTPGVGKEASSP
jgi:hypothetical protein